MRSDSKARDIFYGVVAIATLIVALVGATLAYFSVTASSSEGAVNATAATVSIEYNDGQQVTAQANKLIPSTLDVVKTVYGETIANLDPETPWEGNACIDSNNREVCSAYRFTISSDAKRIITATLNNEHNGFTYLSYAVYDVTAKEWLVLSDEGDFSLPLTACDNENEETEDDCYTEVGTKKEYKTPEAVNSIFGYTIENSAKVNQTQTISSETAETKIYDLVLFIKETNENQNVDQGKKFSGNIVVDVIDGIGGGHITGCVGDDC